MIKVVVTDMDGTLLNEKHEISEPSLRAIEKLDKENIRLIISTGRHYISTMRTLEKYNIKCDYIVASGAEVRDQEGKVLKQIPMDHSNFQEILDRIKAFKGEIRFCSDEFDYMLGTEEDKRKSMLLEAKHFFNTETPEEVEASELFQKRLASVKCIDSVEDLRELNVTIYKIFIFSSEEAVILEMDKALSSVEGIVSASSFPTNLELTHINAQKGIALKEYIEKLGFAMEEVMVLGDSMNDYSMLSMDFGATVAMENAMEEIKKVSKYMTKSNNEDGFAYAIEKMLCGELEDLKKSIKRCD
jgi:Cof subfamily protein (haloacid dehalogenase superfamily)